MTTFTKHVAVAAMLLALAAGAATAGGHEAPMFPDAEPSATAASRFAGAYGGVTLGYGFGGEDEVGVKGGALGGAVDIGTLELDGGLAGLQAGYRWAFGATVIGVELGATVGDVADSFEDGADSAESKLRQQVSLTGSLGREIAPGTLLYGLAGASRAEFEYAAAGPDGADIDEDFSRTGYVAGVGLERAIGARWSVRGEYRYMNYGKEELSDAAGHKTSATPVVHMVSIGLNYRF